MGFPNFVIAFRTVKNTMENLIAVRRTRYSSGSPVKFLILVLLQTRGLQLNTFGKSLGSVLVIRNCECTKFYVFFFVLTMIDSALNLHTLGLWYF